MPGLVRHTAPSLVSQSEGDYLLSVGSIILHDTLKCEIFRSPIDHLGLKSLGPGQPNFVLSRLSVQLRFSPLDSDEAAFARKNFKLGTNGSPTYLEYVDARIALSDTMAVPEEDGLPFSAPLHLADALSGEGHYQRIVRAGSALIDDLREANRNREERPKRRATGGFIVKDGGHPIVGMLGAQWLDGHAMTPTALSASSRSTAISTISSLRAVAIGTTRDSLFSAASCPAGGRSALLSCKEAHWEGKPSGSGTDEVMFQLKPAISKCLGCRIRPLQCLSAIARGKRIPGLHNLSKQAKIACLAPNRVFRLVMNLMSYDRNVDTQPSGANKTAGDPPDDFYAHFRIVFYFSDDRDLKRGEDAVKTCCVSGRHVFSASVKIGQEGDARLKRKKASDMTDALARLEGTVSKAGSRHD